MRVLRHLAAVVLLPGMVTVVVPALLLVDAELGPWPLGSAPCCRGRPRHDGLDHRAVRRVGRGTLAPWDPTRGSSRAGPTGACATR